LRQIGIKEAILRGYVGMGWLLKMSLRRLGEAVFERDKAFIPFRAQRCQIGYKKGVNFICRKEVKCVDYLHQFLIRLAIHIHIKKMGVIAKTIRMVLPKYVFEG